jgi:hypothetical protein
MAFGETRCWAVEKPIRLDAGLSWRLRKVDDRGGSGPDIDPAFARHESAVLMPSGRNRVNERPRGINFRRLKTAHESDAPLLDPLQPILGIGCRQPHFDKRDTGRPLHNVGARVVVAVAAAVVAVIVVTVVVVAIVTVTAVVRRSVKAKASAIVSASTMTAVMAAVSTSMMSTSMMSTSMMSTSVIPTSVVAATMMATTVIAMSTTATSAATTSAAAAASTTLSECFRRKTKHR